MIEDFTDYNTVEEGECFTTGLIDGSKIACSEISYIGLYFTDSKGDEWFIKDMGDGPPILIRKDEDEGVEAFCDWREE